MLKEILLAGVGGFVGSASRYALSLFMCSIVMRSGFPAGTLLVNITGSLLIGIFWVVIPHGDWQVVSIAGFCGGFTTFSAFSLEVVKMLRCGEIGLAAIYIIASVVVCVLCVWAGMALADKFTGTVTA